MTSEIENNNFLEIDDKMPRDIFVKFRHLIENNYGVKLPDHKRVLLQCRLKRRLKVLEIYNFRDYWAYLERNKKEVQNMIDVVTTHKTDFFRENDHFVFLSDVIIPEILKSKNKLNFWSAGCSTGEEPYTLAITLNELFKKGFSFDYEIFASDVSAASVNSARKGIYRAEKVVNIPMNIKKKYFLKNKNPEKKNVRIIPALQKNVRYFVLNLLDDEYNIKEYFDLVFCRNTLIYFNTEVQEKVLSQICKRLYPGGYLMIGHSESIMKMNLPVKQVKPTVFRKI